jgi:V/A-type H+-transporting ATPase subunit F
MEIAVIGDENTVTGFRLAGIKRTYGLEYGKENLKKIMTDETVGVLIVTERFVEENPHIITERKSLKRMTPIIVEVPDCSGPVDRGFDPIKELIKRAIGTDIK